jgi:hypothetical protein
MSRSLLASSGFLGWTALGGCTARAARPYDLMQGMGPSGARVLRRSFKGRRSGLVPGAGRGPGFVLAIGVPLAAGVYAGPRAAARDGGAAGVLPGCVAVIVTFGITARYVFPTEWIALFFALGALHRTLRGAPSRRARRRLGAALARRGRRSSRRWRPHPRHAGRAAGWLDVGFAFVLAVLAAWLAPVLLPSAAGVAAGLALPASRSQIAGGVHAARAFSHVRELGLAPGRRLAGRGSRRGSARWW